MVLQETSLCSEGCEVHVQCCRKQRLLLQELFPLQHLLNARVKKECHKMGLSVQTLLLLHLLQQLEAYKHI